MNALEAAVRKLAMLQRGNDMPLNFRFLTRNACFGPHTDLLVDAVPHKTSRHHLPSGLHARVCKAMDAVKDSAPPRKGNRPWNARYWSPE